MEKLHVASGQYEALREAGGETRRLLEASADKYARLAERLRIEREQHKKEIEEERAAGKGALREAQVGGGEEGEML